jgi:hypothetical protein
MELGVWNLDAWQIINQSIFCTKLFYVSRIKSMATVKTFEATADKFYTVCVCRYTRTCGSYARNEPVHFCLIITSQFFLTLKR